MDPIRPKDTRVGVPEDLVTVINNRLKLAWTPQEAQEGRDILVADNMVPFVGMVADLFRSAGWQVKTFRKRGDALRFIRGIDGMDVPLMRVS